MTNPNLPPTWLETKGQQEDRYALGPLLGHGGMGEVFEAWDTVLARPVALKILRHLEPAAMIRFMHEAQLHARLDCPNICRIYDVDASKGAPRIAMQLVRGPNLEDASPELRLDEIITIIARVAEALHAAHRLNLIHRDIKPSNILLEWAETGGWTPYICDFGLAMALDGPSVTQPLAMTGTPAYMAPEQVRGDRTLICPATDVYGIGSTLYFALTGRPPCISTVTCEMLRVKRERRYPSPRSLEPEIPVDLETILFKCLQPDPADRYASTLELAEELRRFQQGRAIHTVPRGLPQRVRVWSRRNWPLLATTAIIVSLAFGLTTWSVRAQERSVRQAELGQYFTLEATKLEQNLSNERMLPLHDLRPAFAQTRARMAALKDKLAVLGPEAEGPLRYALGRTHFFLRDFPAARAELEQAWSAGFRTPEAAFLLARLQSWAYLKARAEAHFSSTTPPPEAAQALATAESLFRQARGLNHEPQEFADATLAFAQQQYQRAAGLAQASLSANAWHLDSANLAALSLSALAAGKAEQGEAAAARNLYTQAETTARVALALSPNQEGLHHALSVASLGLATLALEQGELSLAVLANLESQAATTLLLNAENPQAQSDWLQVACLKVMRMLQLGQDPRQLLRESQQYFWTRTREPRTVALRVDRMVLYYLQACLELAQGQDPLPALTEAGKDAGHAVGRHRDFYGDLLNAKARLEASRGQDPRPTVATILTRFEPPAGTPGQNQRCEQAAEGLLTQAEWELKAGLDTNASLRRAQDLLQRALQSRPTSASAHALLGETQLLEAQLQPDHSKEKATMAQEQLKYAMRLNPANDRIPRLRYKLLTFRGR